MRTATLLLTLTLMTLSAPPPAPAAPGIAWAPCPEVAAGVECGSLSVPVDWSRPHGPRLDVALARLPAGDPAARIGSLVVNPGGPGSSGVDFVAFIAEESFLDSEITRRFDVVGFDPRGVARSHPVTCSAELLTARPFPFRARTGPLFDRTDTLSTAHDLDAIRAALGEPRLSFYGLSYGTLLGELYAERFSRRVRAIALDSVMDHSLTVESYLDIRAAFAQNGFEEFVAWNDRTPASALHGRDVRTVWAGLLERADRGELSDPANPNTTLTGPG